MIKKVESKLNCNVNSVYEYNGLSMQELLSEFFTKINECVDISNEGINILKWLQQEGLPKEVIKHLERWISDGTLDNIINTGIFTDLNNKIINNINKTTVLSNEVKSLGEPQIFIVPHYTNTQNSDMTVIRSYDGKYHMIDCGSNECSFDYYKNKLDEIGVSSLENLFITHFHTDHVGQATEIIRRYKPKKVYGRTVDFDRLPSIEVTWETKRYYDMVRDEVARQGCEYIELSETTYNLNDKEKITCYGSDYVNYSNYNHMSVAFMYNYGNYFRMYFAGDTTTETEKHIMANHKLENVHILKVGHHGWTGSTSEDFAWALKPQMSIMGNADWLFKNDKMGNVAQHLYYAESKIYDTLGVNNGVTINVNKNGYTCNAKQFFFPPLWFDAANGKTYYFNENGISVRDNYVTYKGRSLYINSGYALVKSNWIDMGNGDFLYADKNGYLINDDWYEINNQWYYFKSNHYMVRDKNNYFIKGKYYNFLPNGVCTNPNQ